MGGSDRSHGPYFYVFASFQCKIVLCHHVMATLLTGRLRFEANSGGEFSDTQNLIYIDVMVVGLQFSSVRKHKTFRTIHAELYLGAQLARPDLDGRDRPRPLDAISGESLRTHARVR